MGRKEYTDFECYKAPCEGNAEPRTNVLSAERRSPGKCLLFSRAWLAVEKKYNRRRVK